MLFSIIIPTFNPGAGFSALLQKLSLQKCSSKEIVIVDSGSRDNTVEIAKKYTDKIIPIDNKMFDHGATRNLGVRHSVGEYLLFITQDILPVDDNLLSIFEIWFDKKDIGGAYGRQLPRPNANPVEALTRHLSYPTEDRLNTYDKFNIEGVRALYFANPCACVRRSVYEEVGGFPDKIICNEDMVMAHKILKAGYRTAYASKAVVYHSHNYTAKQLFRRYFDIGVFFTSYPELKSTAKNIDEGVSQVIKSIKALIKQNNFFWIPILLIETAVKLIGYKSGEQFRILPNRLRKKMSQNKCFWEKNHQCET